MKPCYISFPEADEQHSVMKELRSRFRGVRGRGTVIIAATKGAIPTTLSDNDKHLKLSWQMHPRTYEGDINRNNTSTTLGWCDHLDHPYYTKTAAEDITLPEPQICGSLSEEGHIHKAPDANNHCFRVIFTRNFKKLRSVRSIDEFKRVFLDCLECG